MWTFRVERENNLIMEHVLPVLRDDIWKKWEKIFKDYESGDYVDPKTGAVMKDTKGFKPKKVVKNDLKQFRGLSESELDMAANQILNKKDGEKHPRHTLKTVRDWAANRKRKNETYIAMAHCLEERPLWLQTVDQKDTIDRDCWRVWKIENDFGKLQRERLVDLLGGEYLYAAMNPTRKKLPIPERFKEGVRNILGAQATQGTPEHVVLSLDDNYKISGGLLGLPVLHAFMDTRFLPGLDTGVGGGARMKEVVVSTLKALGSACPGIVESPQLWTVVSEYPDRHFVHNVFKTNLPNNVRFCDALYHGTKEEKIASRDCFFESNTLRITTCIFPEKGESSSEVALRLCGGRKMIDMHYPERYARYSEKRAYSNEEGKTLFKGELRMQTYIDIIKPSSLEGTIFLNICGGNKAHIVAHVCIQQLLIYCLLEFWILLICWAHCTLLIAPTRGVQMLTGEHPWALPTRWGWRV
jgi:hypothetical protein